MKKTFLITVGVGIIPLLVWAQQFQVGGGNNQFSPIGGTSSGGTGNIVASTGLNGSTNSGAVTLSLVSPVAVANGGTASTTAITAAQNVGIYSLTTFGNLFTTTGSYGNQMIVYNNGGGPWPTGWNDSGTTAWKSRPDFWEKAQIGDPNVNTSSIGSNVDGSFPLLVIANSYPGNATNGNANANDAQGVIRIKNMTGLAGASAAIFAEMGTNAGTGYTTVDQNAVQFGTVTQGGPEYLSSGSVGIIADQGTGTYGYPWIFAVPQRIGGEGSPFNHTWLGFDSINDVVHFCLMQANVWSWTNSLSKDVLKLDLKNNTVSILGTLTVSNIFATNLTPITVTSDNAPSGGLGEFVNSLVAIGSAISLSTANVSNVTSISLTAGDWDVEGNVNFSAASATVTGTQAGISVTTITMPVDGSEVYSGVQVTILSEKDSITLPRKRISIAATTTVYLEAKATFSAGTVTAFGQINARRVR